MRKIVLLFVVLGLASFASAACTGAPLLTVSNYSANSTPATANTGTLTGCTSFTITSIKGVFHSNLQGQFVNLLVCNSNPCTLSNSHYIVLVNTDNNGSSGVDQHDNVQYIIPVNGGGVQIQFDTIATGDQQTVMLTGHGN